MANIKTVFKNTLLYSSSSLLLRASSIFLFPIFSYYLTKSDYGTISISQSITSIIATFAGLQLGRAITRFAFHGVNEKIDQNQTAIILRSSFTLVFLSNLLIVVFLIVFGSNSLNFILNDIPFYPYIFFSVIAMPFTAIIELYKIYLQAQHSGKKVFIIDMLYFGGNISLNLLLISIFKMGALGIIYSNLINSVLFTIYFFIKEPHFFLPKLDINALMPLLKYSFPFIPFILLGFLMENTDRLFLNSKTNSASSGIYYIATTFASIFSIGKESLVTALTPWFFDNFKDTNFRKIEKLFYLVIWGIAIFAVSISLFSYEILYLLSSNQELVSAWRYIPLFVIGLFIVFIGQIYALPAYHSTSTVKYLFIANLMGFITNFIGCFLLIDKFEMFGAGVSKIIGYSVMTLTFIIINNYTSNFRIKISYIIFPLLMVFAVSWGNWLDIPPVVKFSMKTIFITIASGILVIYIAKSFGGITQFKEFIKSPPIK